MEFLSNLYSKAASEADSNLRFWEDYLKNLQELDFKAYSEKLTVPVLVPIGSRILFRGELKHTNEVITSMGADYFAKCSVAQAEVLRQHRIKDAKSTVNQYRKGKEYLENQFMFRNENLNENGGQEIVEVYTEEEDKAWRVKHRENLRKHKIKQKHEREVGQNDYTNDEDLWNRLEELELQEELENELGKSEGKEQYGKSKLLTKEDSDDNDVEDEYEEDTYKVKKGKSIQNVSKLDLLQKVIDRQNELDEKLQELKNKERSMSRTENDLISRLDEMEQLDELEDEMDRLDDIIEGEEENEDADQDIEQSSGKIAKRGVVFADEDDSETLEITFKHSDVSPSTEAYDPSKGIQKPSDIYSVYSNLFNETTSILKRTKYPDNKTIEKTPTPNSSPRKVSFQLPEDDEDQENVSRTIVIKDVAEKADQQVNKLESLARPTSLFKKKRMQNKS